MNVSILKQYRDIGLQESLLNFDGNYSQLADSFKTYSAREIAGKRVRGEYLAYCLIVAADSKHFGKLKED